MIVIKIIIISSECINVIQNVYFHFHLGLPKGVMLSHQNLVSNIEQLLFVS